MGRPTGSSQLSADELESGGVRVIAVHIAQETAQPVESPRVESAVFLQTVARTVAELLEGPARLGHTDHGHVEVSAFRHRVQRGKNLLVSQVARRAEEDQGVR